MNARFVGFGRRAGLQDFKDETAYCWFARKRIDPAATDGSGPVVLPLEL
jgi:hypothetical protein